MKWDYQIALKLSYYYLFIYLFWFNNKNPLRHEERESLFN